MPKFDAKKVAEVHQHLHSHLPSESALRVKTLETLLEQKGLVNPATIDAWVEAYTEHIGPKRGAHSPRGFLPRGGLIASPLGPADAARGFAPRPAEGRETDVNIAILLQRAALRARCRAWTGGVDWGSVITSATGIRGRQIIACASSGCNAVLSMRRQHCPCWTAGWPMGPLDTRQG